MSEDREILVDVCSDGSKCERCHGQARVLVQSVLHQSKLCPLHWALTRMEYGQHDLVIVYAEGARVFSRPA